MWLSHDDDHEATASQDGGPGATNDAVKGSSEESPYSSQPKTFGQRTYSVMQHKEPHQTPVTQHVRSSIVSVTSSERGPDSTDPPSERRSDGSFSGCVSNTRRTKIFEQFARKFMDISGNRAYDIWMIIGNRG